MANKVILINGLPGSGKSTLGRSLAQELELPFLSKDAVKETLANSIAVEVPSRYLGIAAMETVWTVAAAVPGTIAIDSWWFRPRDLMHAQKGLVVSGTASTVEVWCDVPAALAKERYEERHRHGVHNDARKMDEEWTQWAAEGVPLEVGPVIRVDTSSPVTIEPLAAAVRKALAPVESTAWP